MFVRLEKVEISSDVLMWLLQRLQRSQSAYASRSGERKCTMQSLDACYMHHARIQDVHRKLHEPGAQAAYVVSKFTSCSRAEGMFVLGIKKKG